MPLNSCKKSDSHVDYFSEQVDSPNVLVIGGTSFIGSRIALGLRDIGYNVTLVDDWINLSIEPMTWYRQDKLVENKISVNYVDFSDVVSTNSLLAENNHGSIVYVPSLLFDGKQEKTCSYDYLKSSILLKNFVTLLEKARACSLKIIFVTSNEEKAHSIQKALLKTFELILYFYSNSPNNLSITTLKVEDVYGPWQGKRNDFLYHSSTDRVYIDELTENVVMAMKCNNLSCSVRSVTTSEKITDNEISVVKTQQWVSEYSKFLRLPKKNVVMTSYFTGPRYIPNKNYYILPDLFQFFEAWFLTGKQFGVHFVIFHDHLSQLFQSKMKNFYPGHVEFVKLSSLNGRSVNDIRYYIQYNYLQTHPEIRNVLLTDSRDVIFLQNPFKVMEVIGDYLYMGIDNSFFSSIYESWVGRWSLKPCLPSELNTDAAKRYPVHNAGVIGGSRHVMLAYLTQLILYLDRAPHKKNCNMGIVSLVTEKHFANDYFSGYPFQAVMELPLAIPQGLAIRHKRTGEV